jgi:PAS domain S-box-containing protein
VGGKGSEKSDLFQILTEKSLAGIYVVQNERFRSINTSAASYAGRKPEELIGEKSDSILHPDDRQRVKHDARAMLRGERSSPHEFRIITRQGRIRWILETVVSISYEGKPAILGNSMDITERKMAEEALQESEQRLADIIEFLPDATFAIDLEGIIIAWNRATEDLTGMKADKVVGKGNYEHSLPWWGVRRPMLIDLVLKPDFKFEETYTRLLKKEKDLLVAETEVPGIQIMGRNAYLWGKASPLYDGKGNIVGAIEVIRDITERKMAEEAILKRERELEIKSNELEELNTALKVLLKRREEDKNDLEEKLLANVKDLVFPYIEELKKGNMDERRKTFVNILESNLKNILSPFGHRISSKYMNLTDREIQVASLIKEGKSSKEIADLLSVTESAINIYRYRIRKKLGLGKTHNLKAYLSSLA